MSRPIVEQRTCDSYLALSWSWPLVADVSPGTPPSRRAPTRLKRPGGPPPQQAGPQGDTFVNDFKMAFVRVPKGGEIPHDFYLGAYEVTQEQWQAVMGKNPSSHSATGGNAKKVQGIPSEELKRFPVERVSWPDTQDFLARLNTKAALTGWRYRLPTATEWKYACRGAEPRQEKILFAYYFKDGLTGELTIQKANFGAPVLAGRKQAPGALGRPCPVGSYEPNRLGLYDMHGNVWEWCQELHSGFKNTRVRHGGAYSSEARDCAVNQSQGYDAKFQSADQGLRVALAPVP